MAIIKSSRRSSSPPSLIHQHHLQHTCIFILLIFTITTTSFISSTNGLHLTGVTVLPDHPRADTLSSFFAHLLDEVAQLGNFSFSLRVMPPATKHGGAVREGDKPEGLVGEVVNDKADFVIADLEVTRHRASLLEFTRPFLSAKLAALVSRNRKQSPISTSEQEQLLSPSLSFDDHHHHHHSSSAEVEDNHQQPPQTLRSVLLNSKRVFVRGSVVEDFFRTASDKKVARLMPTAVASLKDAVALLANDTEVAVIGDSARLALIAAHDCQLEVITSTAVGAEDMNSTTSEEIGVDFSVDFAVGFHHMNAAFHQFNIALEELEVAGRLAELVDTYWRSGPCTREREEQQQADFSAAGFTPDETVQENHGSSLRFAFLTKLLLLMTFFLGFFFTVLER